MPITHNSEQSQELEDFYRELANREAQQYQLKGYMPGAGQAMLQLLSRINELFPRTPLWGLTSHYRLIVQNTDDWQAAWLVRIVSGIDGTFYFEYLLPSTARPWRDATVHGEAATLADAERYLLIAMRECQGWQGNAELEALFSQYGLAG